mmetsp:Transcript_64115/g.164999  ORF Transcript_64115/g.164999 Transcript_64115/m.164999 type:complete len:238 (-) Transcript_64115:2551-3264(-)
MIHRISRRKPPKSSWATSLVQWRTTSWASSLSLFSPVSDTPSDRIRRFTSGLGSPGWTFLVWFASSALPCTSAVFAMKTSRNSSTSRGENWSSRMSASIRSSSWVSCSVSRMRHSCMKVQNLISPSPPTSSTPASFVRSHASWIFFTRAFCSSLFVGSQLNSLRSSMSSLLSISPPWSLSKWSNISWNCAIFSSLKPAFLRSRATTSRRLSSMISTKSSKSTSFLARTSSCMRSGSS